jgi:hypothetical protein
MEAIVHVVENVTLDNLPSAFRFFSLQQCLQGSSSDGRVIEGDCDLLLQGTHGDTDHLGCTMFPYLPLPRQVTSVLVLKTLLSLLPLHP